MFLIIFLWTDKFKFHFVDLFWTNSNFDFDDTQLFIYLFFKMKG